VALFGDGHGERELRVGGEGVGRRPLLDGNGRKANVNMMP